ncbi:MAG TPA: rRNA pseudouridine synthase [Candidatus Onthocola gallistercoris]|uniref:Pseudouridine synthase n=1 Tax=Candidatus Onthocola gallistercoris TaxID=2840876 RepID=A0A9D1HJ65_9FIRM|nr:rRNA pseudouridine synthase [Candidatus Onthocola gallistercoris]
MDKKIRLDKYLADMGMGTRSGIKSAIRKGQVQVNGVVARSSDQKVAGSDLIQFNGQTVTYLQWEYILLNKPAGVLSATEDKKDRTVLDLIESPRKGDLFPVGRLDKDTEGLLLITNDGALAHRLLAPKSHVAKVYYAEVSGKVTRTDVDLFASGLQVDASFKALPAKLEIISADENRSKIRLEIYEGKFHQVKRMFQAVGKEVQYLKRLSMGPLVLDKTLEPGQWRRLDEKEIQILTGEKRDV